jgi:hypothetical protein
MATTTASSTKRIAPGNPDFADMLAIDAFLHMMPPEQLVLVLELTNERLAVKGKTELTRQELLPWICVCMLIASINFGGDHCKVSWEGSGRYSNSSPPTRATDMLHNRFDDIWYAVRWSYSYQPFEQPDGMSSERYCWMLVNNFIANINKYRKRTFVPGGHLEPNKTVI